MWQWDNLWNLSFWQNILSLSISYPHLLYSYFHQPGSSPLISNLRTLWLSDMWDVPSLWFERKTSGRVRLLVSVFVHKYVRVIIMPWAEAIWVCCLICISGVNLYKYLWPWSKLVWIFILPLGCRRVEWLWFQSVEEELTQRFLCGWCEHLMTAVFASMCLVRAICIWLITFAFVIL